LCETLPAGPDADRVDAVIALIDSLACFEDWGAAKAFLHHLKPDETLSLLGYSEALIALLNAGGDHRLSLQDIADCLAATQAHAPELSPARALAQLTERLIETRLAALETA
jgi:hypothetical protein